MRNLFAAGGSLAAALLLVMAMVAATSSSTAPTAQAQDACSASHCLIIEKMAEPDDSDQEFSFDAGDAGTFSLAGGENHVLELDGNGTVTVQEAEADGWVLTDLTCSGDDVTGVDVTADADGGSVEATFETADDEFATVTCTFTNEMEDGETPTVTATEPGTPEEGTPDATASVTPPDSTPETPATTPETGDSVRPPNTGSGGLKQ